MSNPARPGERERSACSDAGCCSLPLPLPLPLPLSLSLQLSLQLSRERERTRARVFGQPERREVH